MARDPLQARMYGGTCPGVLGEGATPFYFAVGQEPYASLARAADRPDWLARGDAEAARRLIQLQIDATPERVGPPIHVVEITRHSVTVNKISVSSLSAISANLGNANIGVNGWLSTAGVSWGSGTGVFIGWNGSSYGIRASAPSSGDRFRWDGSTLRVRSGAVQISGSGIELDSGSSYSTARRIAFGSTGEITRPRRTCGLMPTTSC